MSNTDLVLYEVLRIYRNLMYGDGISYYTNDDIKLICEVKPKNKDDILAIKGILNGEKKFNKMGIDIIRFTLAIVNSDDKNNAVRNNISFIETSLHEYVINRLKKKAEEDPQKDYWFDYVPEKIRIDASTLVEKKKGTVSKDSCLYLTDLWGILETNWGLFSNEISNKKEFGSNFNKLKEIRNRLAHPLVLTEHPLQEEDRVFVSHMYEVIEKLVTKK
jgi:hypothetical protein